MLIQADARQIPLRDGCVQCVVTSPPYFGLRDYGIAQQIGLEPTPEAYIAAIVAVFQEVRRVLADDGVCWLNLGDSYAGSGKGGNPDEGKQATNRGSQSVGVLYGKTGETARQAAVTNITRKTWEIGAKAKDLLLIPARCALALQADGWYLRSDIIWHKPNPMPESVTDRPTKAHEYLFLLSKNERYYYDSAAIAERVAESGIVEGAHLANQTSAFGDYGWLQEAAAKCTTLAPSIEADAAGYWLSVGVRLAASVLNGSELKNQVGLLSLDAEVWDQGPHEIAGADIGHGPVIRRATSQASRFADGDVTAEEFLRELYGFWVALPDGHQLKEAWGFAFLYIGLIDRDRNASVRVNDAGEIGQLIAIHREQYIPVRMLSLKKEPTRGRGYGAAKGGFNGRTPDRDGGFGPSLHMRETPRNDGDRWRNVDGGVAPRGLGRNRRTVWTIPTMPYSGAHFATMPEALVEPCILAGSRVGDLVFDPFIGSGTVGAVAERLGRRWVGTDLNPAYHQLAKKRTAQRGLRWGA